MILKIEGTLTEQGEAAMIVERVLKNKRETMWEHRKWG